MVNIVSFFFSFTVLSYWCLLFAATLKLHTISHTQFGWLMSQIIDSDSDMNKNLEYQNEKVVHVYGLSGDIMISVPKQIPTAVELTRSYRQLTTHMIRASDSLQTPFAIYAMLTIISVVIVLVFTVGLGELYGGYIGRRYYYTFVYFSTLMICLTRAAAVTSSMQKIRTTALVGSEAEQRECFFSDSSCMLVSLFALLLQGRSWINIWTHWKSERESSNHMTTS